MRAFLLVALLAMAATVSCEDFPVSASCNTTSTAVNVNTNVTAAAAAINKTGCTELDVNPTSSQCTQTTGAINCLCSTILNNVATWQSAVVNASGQACLLQLTVQINGTHTENGTVTPITWTITHNNLAYVAFGNACNTTEIAGALLAPSAAATLAELGADLNANNVTTGTVWTSASGTVTGCGAVYTGVKNIPAYIPSTTPTTAPTSTPTGNGTTTAPTSTVAPTNKPGSSTGGNGASTMTASTFLVAALVAAGIIAA